MPDKIAPFSILTVSFTVPFPPRAAPLFTVTLLPEASEPFTVKIPSDTVIGPVYVLAADKTTFPEPVFVMLPFPLIIPPNVRFPSLLLLRVTLPVIVTGPLKNPS